MNSKNIYNACRGKGMKPLCDRANWFDGRCEVVGRYMHQVKRVKRNLQNAFLYAGFARGDRSRKHRRHRQRWSTKSDKDYKTLCVKPQPTSSTQFEWEGFELHRVKVKGKVNSHSI